MASKSGSGKKSGSTRSGDAGDKDRIIGELKERVAVLENELQLKQSNTTPQEVIDREPMGEYLALFQRMVDKAADMVFLLGPMGRILYVNDAASKVLGYTREELQSMTVFDINHKHHVDNWQEHEERLKKQGSLTFENVLKTKDNRLIPVENSANYARLGDKEYNYSFIRDITERKQIEEELRSSRDELEQRVQERTRELSKSEATLRQIIDTSPLPMVVYREEKIYYINNKFVETFGYTVADIPSIAEWWPLAYPNKAYCEFVKNRWYAAVDDAVKNKTSITPQEATVTCKDGSNRDVLAFFSSIGDMNLAILQDITERKNAEDALKLTQFALDNFRDSAIWLTLDGSIMYVNQETCKSLGYSKEELLSMHIWDIDPDYSQDRFQGLWRESYQQGFAVKFESEHVARNGRVFPVEVTSCYTKYGDKEYLITFDRDITERKRAEKALSRDRYILMKSQEVAHLGNWAWDLETGEFTGSDENYRIYGYESGGVKPTREWVLSRAHPEDRAAVADFMEASARDGKRGSTDFRVIRPDGSVVYVNAIVDKAVRDKTGKVTRLYGITQDITERKQTEEQLKTAKQQAELYLDLMGHDINNMHQVALGYLELARDLPAGADQAGFLDKSVEVLQRSTQLIGNVRKLQKIHDGLSPGRDVDVCRILEDIQSEYGAVPGKTIRLNLNGHDHCLVRANELLHDVYANLVNNAIKHTGDGSEIAIDLDLIEDNGTSYYCVAVEDNGPGVHDDNKKSIFNQRISNHMRIGSSRSMGIGLYIVKSLVESYGGRVWAEDRVKGDHTKGARFMVLLPSVEKSVEK